MDDMVYKMARKKFNHEMLDVKYICKEIRENKYMKEMLFEKSQLMRLKESWRNVIDPRKGYVGGVKQ